MGTTIGTDLNGGWTIITPSSNGYGFGTGYNGTGSRICFVDSTYGGVPTPDGTLAHPFTSIISALGTSPGTGCIRSGSPDWVLIRNGTSYTEASTIFIQVPGPAFSAPLSSYTPAVISSYDASAANNPPVPNPGTGGARPIINMASGNSGFALGGSGNGDGFAIMGLDLYCPRRDPTNQNFVQSDYNSSPSAIGWSPPVNWQLVEDCRVNWFGFGIALNTTPNTGQQYSRRNVVLNCLTQLSPNNGRCNAHDMTPASPSLLQETLIDGGGWYPPTPVTITTGSPGVITWGTAPPSWNGTSADNGFHVRLYAGWSGGVQSALPSQLFNGQTYFVSNSGTSGTNTFRLADTFGGTEKNLSGGSGSTFYATFLEHSGRPQCHNIYAHDPGNYNFSNLVAPFTIDQNILSAGAGTTFRTGGPETNNLFIEEINGQSTSKATPNSANTVQNNVWSGGYNAQATQSAGGTGGIVGDAYDPLQDPTATLDMSGNILTNATNPSGASFCTIGAGFTGINIHNNISYNWGTIRYLTEGGVLSYSSPLVAAGSGGSGVISNISAIIYPGTTAASSPPGTNTVHTVNMVGGTGSGAQIQVIVGTSGKVLSMDARCGGIIAMYPPYASDFKVWNGTDDGTTTGNSCKVIAGGTGYSSGDVLTPSTIQTGYGTLWPTDFQITVGPYLADTATNTSYNAADQPATNLSYVTGSGGTGAQAWIFFQTTGGTTKATSASLYTDKDNYYGGQGYSVGDLLTPTNSVAGITGIQFRVASVSANNIYGNHENTLIPTYLVGMGNYYTSVLGLSAQPTADGLIKQMAGQSKSSWQTNLTANAVNTWVRAAFGIGIAPPPVVSTGASVSRSFAL